MTAAEGKVRVLVVDDNEQNRALAQATLEDEGYDVSLASSGEEALTLFDAEHPDCVVLDVRMPGMDGPEVCKRIRARDHGKDTPVLFLTALRDLDTFDSAQRAGGDDFLTKPVRPAELVSRVAAAVRLRLASKELGDLYDLVKRQRDDLMRLQLQKERLTAFLVHDLKNPVNAMDLHAQILVQNRGLPEDARESAQNIRTAARALLRLIVNLLDISKAEEGQLVPPVRNVDLKAVVVAAFADMSAAATRAGITLESDLHAQTVRGDTDMLERVLENLLENALRYAPRGSVVRVTSDVNERFVELRVIDSGPGIPVEMREKIFERFAQLEQGNKSWVRASRGLGLAFCKLAVETLGGRISVEDTPAGGSTFCVRLRRDE